MPLEIEQTVDQAFWCQQITTYEQKFQVWEKRARKIVKRYKDERENNEENLSRFNILWSNVQTLAPALYARDPKPNIDRRHEDDEVGRVAAQVLERAVMFYVENDLFGETMRQCVLDRLLPGRGTLWVRYCPQIEREEKVLTDDQVEYDETLAFEEVVPDYVHWEDFGHMWARTFEEMRAGWRKVYLSRKKCIERFGEEIGSKIPLESVDKKKQQGNQERKAIIYEIWDKETKTVYWVNKSMEDILDKQEDPLRLQKFFPFPKPLYSTLANDNLIPASDYHQYQDQALELDSLTGRINSITKAIKVAGVYDATSQAVERLLSEGIENQLIPVEQWAVFGGEKGGLKGVVDFMPMVDILQTLLGLYEAREKVKQDLYEITGISDVIRGATNPNETATAQQIKGQYATLRLDNMQSDVARLSRDVVRLFAEIIGEHFSLETIKQVSGMKLLTAQEKQQIEIQQQAEMVSQQTGQPSIPEEIEKALSLPTWEEIMEVLSNDMLRSFKIDIETDSTIKADQDAEREARTEFLGAVSGFLQVASTIQDPTIKPLLMEMLKFGVQGFRAGRTIEGEFATIIEGMKKQAENPQPQADPEVEKMKMQAQMDQQNLQAKGQQEQMKMQFEGKKMEQEKYLADQNFALEQQRLGVEQEKIKGDVTKAKFDAKTKITGESAMMDPELNDGAMPIADSITQLAEAMTQGLVQIAQMQVQSNQAVIQSNNQLLEALIAPKVIVRDAQGKAAGVRVVVN